jgi:cysteinyl-tRNA synthetase
MVHIIKGSNEKNLASGESFPMTLFGATQKITNNSEGIPDDVWKRAYEFAANSKDVDHHEIPEEVANILKDREEARHNNDYPLADRLRDQAKTLGWAIEDTVEGARLRKLE